ncbi:MAG: twin-arginine translocase subunit TatC [Candidatus Nephthysia bennettiae]|uniref:Sec-independent protein translocase protein TatC n=1 Tax=Candidatus Nephthysia bennettiae TaxID=3127016 RepID=A0A934NDQ5_9BACT|nr:twin-arginine translocase subunit TatC [Candidatus Dormibacteraeota bacterium]PZR94226.1 MAG: twin-arginine translocase subunit TatC [Candidatus Dormibacteraeota bacterium]
MALLTRAPRASSTLPDHHKSMSVVEHLEDLRRALIISVAGWAVATAVAFVFWQRLFELLLIHAGLQKSGVVFLAPTGAFMLGFKIALYLGMVLAAPVIFWQLWWFVSPGLRQHEKRLVLPLIGATSFFFLTGVGFAIFALPLMMRVLTGFAPPDLHFLPVGDELLSFVLALVIAFGLVFELPVILWTLGMLRIISSRWLYRNHVYWIVSLGVLANLMTPGADPITPLIAFAPLVLFWEATALLLKLTGR